MKVLIKTQSTRHPKQRGFALIVTLSLMILLTVIAVGLLTLSSISLRASSQSADMNIARANARMAMMLAIGDSQKFAGLDTRVTAKADILDSANPPITGVWKSWEGTDHELTGNFAGRPVSPGNYATKKQDRFLRWLVSGDPTSTTLPDTTPADRKAILVGRNSVGTGADRAKLQVHLTPTLVNTSTQRGGFAWWVSGENQKARLPRPYEPSADNSGRWAANTKSHSVADPKPFAMDQLLIDASPALKVTSLNQTDLFSRAAERLTSQEHFHDLTPYSIGLLTNSATGGWKKDLSLFTENSTSATGKPGTTNLPLFRVKPGEDIICNLPTTSSHRAAKSILYPWSSYRGSGGEIPIYQHGAVASWENLIDYVLAYRNKGMSVSSSGKVTISPSSTSIGGDKFSFLHRVRVLPVIARIQWVMSHSAGPATALTGQPAPPVGHLEPRLLLTPVITMWNPYNVEMTFSSVPLNFSIPRPLPVALRYSVDGSQNTNYNSPTSLNTNNKPALSTATALNYRISTAFTLKPGEAQVFSPSARPEAAGSTLELQVGYRSRGGHYFPLRTDGNTVITAPPSATIKADAKFDTVYDDAGSLGVGIYLNMISGSITHLAYRMVYTPEVAKLVYKPIAGLATSPPLSALSTNPSPFLTTVFGARMASKTHIAAKGFVQSSPLVNYTAMGGKDLVESTIQRHYGGTNHPVNSPFDYSFERVAPNDSLLPNESDATGRGYIVTGFTKADGLSRCVIAELPTRPLLSIAELQNWDMRYENPIPPFAFNIIGNSDASPLLPANAVANGADAGLDVNLQHDDAYCANHLLFDDWFFSSIAPDPDTFGTSGKNIQKTFTDFVTNSRLNPLGNRAYLPIGEDTAFAAVSATNANTLYNDHVAKSNSWKTIASRLEVEGMFNVNSTSVTAWRALLGHARNQKIPYYKESGVSWNVELSPKSDYAFSRFSVAGDVEAEATGSSGAFIGAAEFAGYRILDEGMLDALAKEVVQQVRLRGPFLSLSEFVNRQLSSGGLALAGAVQSALDQIAKSPSTNPYAVMQDINNRVSLAVPPSSSDAEYKFPDAAVGQSTYGLPGWTRQADVLRPLAPILTARDDTFTIRSYGDARDRNDKITATAVCEVVILRTRNFVDPSDAADLATGPTKSVNQTFGRRFQVVSFRWLSPAEI